MNCRNPWSRVVSWYKHGFRAAQEKQKGFNHDFESFCGTSLNFSELGMGGLIPQADWAGHMDGFIKFENLQEDLFKMCEHLHIPHVSKTIPRTKISDKKSLTSYKDYYTPRSRDLIAKKFAKDIKYFGYEFGD